MTVKYEVYKQMKRYKKEVFKKNIYLFFSPADIPSQITYWAYIR
jgi:hypothetical protein